jgi:hypothetical protein
VRVCTLSGRGVFRVLAPGLSQVTWPKKFKSGPIDKYDGSNNPEEFIQVYHTVIEAVGDDDRVKINYLPTALSGAVRSYLVNLHEGTIYNWDHLCVMFIDNFQVTYERSSTTETSKTIKWKHDKSLWDYVKHFCDARSAIPNIQDIKIINVFHDEISDIKTVEDICDICIEASEARDREVNAADHENRKQQPTDQKEKRSFHSPADAEK